MDDYNDWNYTGGTSDADFESNLSNTAPSEDWFTNTYGANGMDDYNPNYNSGMYDVQTGGGFDPTFGLEQNQYQTMAPPDWQQNGSNWGQIDSQLGTNFNDINTQQGGMSWGDMGSKALAGLGSIFKGSTSQNLGALLTGYMSDQRNKKTGAAAQNMIQQQARPYDQQGTTGANMMGASSMRDAAQIQQALAQQRLDKFRADPTSDAGYKSQQDQILEAQKRVAAARGVRYNPTSSQGAMSPATLAALAQNQMAYDKNYQTDRNSYFTPAGAGMSGGLAEMLAAMQQQSKGDYYSGLAGGAGFTSANQMNDPDYLAKILQLQQQLKG